MRPWILLGWDKTKGLDCDAIDTTYRISNVDCAKIMFDDDGDYRGYDTYTLMNEVVWGFMA